MKRERACESGVRVLIPMGMLEKRVSGPPQGTCAKSITRHRFSMWRTGYPLSQHSHRYHNAYPTSTRFHFSHVTTTIPLFRRGLTTCRMSTSKYPFLTLDTGFFYTLGLNPAFLFESPPPPALIARLRNRTMSAGMGHHAHPLIEWYVVYFKFKILLLLL
jgi:hypothetical protein